MDAKSICLRLLRAESEKEVQSIVESVPEMRDRENWKPLDGRDTNFNVTSNQASGGAKALTELMTNMVDAVLMKHAYREGIDPKGKGEDVPKTMYEAVDRLVKNMRGGKLANLDPKDPWLKEFAAENLAIGVTGASRKEDGRPCYTLVDNGEGQCAKDFKTTFLSLSEGNKKYIPFVQGKYHMGSSGVLEYCGKHGFKLIVSRRHDGNSDWAWTLMRQRPADSDSIPVIEYFILNGKDIPSFDGDVLHPFHNTEGTPYEGVKLTTGTIVKLYDYYIGEGYTGFDGLREALNENLIETILPFRLFELRRPPGERRTGDRRAKGVDPRPFYGMEFHLLNKVEEGEATDEKKIEVNVAEDPELGKISINAFAFKEKPLSDRDFRRNRIFHAVNGQVHYKEKRRSLTRCGFPALKDRVVIVVDASELNFGTHNKVWKGDRENIKETPSGVDYLKTVEDMIADSKSLKGLQEAIAQEERELASETQSEDLLKKFANSEPNIAALLSRHDPKIRLPSSGGVAAGSESSGGAWDGGKYSPTFVRIEENRIRKGVEIEIPLNRSRFVSARTDAENGWLTRPDNCGRIILDNAVRHSFTIQQPLHNGWLTLSFKAREECVSVGELFTFKIVLEDDAMPRLVESEDSIRLRVVEPATSDPDKGKKKKKERSGDGEENRGEGKKSSLVDCPSYVLLTHDGRKIENYKVRQWPDGFDERDGGLVEELGEGEVIHKINYDNAYHLKHLKRKRGEATKKVETAKYILGMRASMLAFEHALRASLEDREGNGGATGIAEFSDDFRRMAARGAALTVLALSETLPKLDTAADADDADAD